MVLRRLIGVIMIMISVTGMGASYFGARLGHQIVDQIGDDVVESLELISESLDSVEETLTLAKSTVGDVSAGLYTMEATIDNLGQSIVQTQPLLDQVGEITTEEIPASVESMQEAIPAMTQAATVIDDTLTTLSNFRMETSVLGVPIGFDLGVEYEPAIPFDESVALVGSSLEGMPERLREMQTDLDLASDNLETLSEDLSNVATDLKAISDRISETEPLIDEYLRIVLEVNDSTRRVKRNVSDQSDSAKRVVTVVTVWLGLAQLAPLYLGLELASGRRLR